MNTPWICSVTLALACTAAHAAPASNASLSVCVRGWSLQDLNPFDGIAASMKTMGPDEGPTFSGDFWSGSYRGEWHVSASDRFGDPGAAIRLSAHDEAGELFDDGSGPHAWVYAYRHFVPGQGAAPFSNPGWTLSPQTSLTYTVSARTFIENLADVPSPFALASITVQNFALDDSFSDTQRLRYHTSQPIRSGRNELLTFTVVNDTDAPMSFATKLEYEVQVGYRPEYPWLP